MAQFQGFTDEFFGFFLELNMNMNRDWFKSNKHRYDAHVVAPVQDLLTDLNQQFTTKSLPFQADLKKAIFRPYRDVRFSKDKTPYKTNIAARIPITSHQSQFGLYLHFSPEESFIGSGFYQLESPKLKAFRRTILQYPNDWRNIENHLVKNNIPLKTTDTLKRLPKGFTEEETQGFEEVIKLKSFITSIDLTPDDITNPDLTQKITKFAEAVVPFLDFGYKAIARQEEAPK